MPDLKSKIVRITFDKIVQDGIKNTTMDEIASLAAISKRTLYENFADKADLIAVVVKFGLKKDNAYIRKVFKESENVLAALLTILKNGTQKSEQYRFPLLMEIKKYYPAIFSDCIHKNHEKQSTKLKDLIKKGIEEEVFCSYINPEIMAMLFSHQIHGFWSFSVYPSFNKFDTRELFDHLIITLLRGICTQKGIQQIEKSLDIAE